jgi:uncharacterized RDD family membrane protein YckC
VNKICSQCGSVLASGERSCSFCESTESLPVPDQRNSAQNNLSSRPRAQDQWRGELNQRLQAYRARRGKAAPNEAQTALPFDRDSAPVTSVAVGLEEHPQQDPPPIADDFAFTIAIGRVAKDPEPADPRVMIDVSVPPQLEESAATPDQTPKPLPPVLEGLFPAASLDDRKRAMAIDLACLAFAYGGFLALFGSLGGHFSINKLSGTICVFTFAFVYLQYFGLFTVFGGSTPGMMVSGIQVASFTGDSPTPRQYLLRAIGYMLSAGTCFLGFLWTFWDEDTLTWHDRLSKTYLARVEALGEEDITQPVGAR